MGVVLLEYSGLALQYKIFMEQENLFYSVITIEFLEIVAIS